MPGHGGNNEYFLPPLRAGGLGKGSAPKRHAFFCENLLLLLVRFSYCCKKSVLKKKRKKENGSAKKEKGSTRRVPGTYEHEHNILGQNVIILSVLGHFSGTHRVHTGS